VEFEKNSLTKKNSPTEDIYRGMRPMGRRIADEFMDETRRPRREWSIQK